MCVCVCVILLYYNFILTGFFFLKKNTKKIFRCQGCPVKLETEFAVGKFGNYPFFDVRQNKMRQNLRNGYFHCSKRCIQNIYPNFSGEVFKSPEINLEHEQLDTFKNSGIIFTK